MKILITGNMGYIGPCVVRQLRNSYPAATLVGYDIGYFADCMTNTDFLPECRVDQQIFADVRNIDKDVLNDVNAIVYLAALSNDPMGQEFEQLTYDINYHATIRLAKMAKSAGVTTFVFASSCSIYGFAEGVARDENSPLNPLTPYAKSKVLTEKDLANLGEKNFKVTSLRFSTACGMSERLRLDLVLNDFVAGAVSTKRITILSDGKPWRPLINIKDMARAIDWAIGRDLKNGGEFLAINVGSEEWNYQIKDLAMTVAGVIPNVNVSVNENAQPDKRSYKVNFDMFKKLAPDYQPVYDLITTINMLKEGLEAMNFDNSNFRDSKYMRLKALKELIAKGFLTERLGWVFKENTYLGKIE